MCESFYFIISPSFHSDSYPHDIRFNKMTSNFLVYHPTFEFYLLTFAFYLLTFEFYLLTFAFYLLTFTFYRHPPPEEATATMFNICAKAKRQQQCLISVRKRSDSNNGGGSGSRSSRIKSSSQPLIMPKFIDVISFSTKESPINSRFIGLFLWLFLTIWKNF
ncbi:hypothetical protein ABH966_004610 [Lysinibacillus sp. RC46]